MRCSESRHNRSPCALRARPVAAAAAGAADALVAARRGLGPRHRHEPVRRLRLRASTGFGYREILATTTRARASNGAARASCACCSQPNRSRVVVHAARPARASAASNPTPSTGRCEAARTSSCEARAAASSKRIAGRAAGHRRGHACACSARPATASADGLYRGALEIRTAAGPGLNAINALGIENYVRGVVPAREPAVWPADGARRRRRSRPAPTRSRPDVSGRGFDQYADTRSQVYRGFLSRDADDERRRSAATRGEVVTYGGRAVVTYFFSTSGGHTENVENVFAGSDPKPWLKGVDDPYDDASPYHRWGPYTYSTPAARRKARQLRQGALRGFKVLQARRLAARRAARRSRLARHVTVTGASAAGRLGLRDTWFYVRAVSSSTAPSGRAGRGPPAATRPLAAIHGSVDGGQARFVKLQRQVDGDVEDARACRCSQRQRRRTGSTSPTRASTACSPAGPPGPALSRSTP